ncbi:MAG TPA: hypothetical protein VMA73_01545 [Streptosporangiaceae bacterium]|nr:hypothetical protein [Streptosporangiaceae bacterium]
MNANPAGTHSPHLDLDDLLAKVSGQAIGDRAREHLATCEHCRAEANRWSLVAGGVRSLAAAAPEVAQPARPRQTGPQVLAGRRRTMLAAGAAAALVLIGGASYGVSAALAGHAPGTARTGTKAAALMAVSGCASLEQADGTLEQVNGTSLVIKTASGQPVTVTTTASTRESVFAAPLSDITDGASVIASGHSSNGTIEAGNVSVGLPRIRSGQVQTPPGIVAVQGAVSDASAAGFTVVTATGAQVPVATSSNTVVHLFHASLSQLQSGSRTVAVGHAGPDGTLSAIAVLQPPRGWRGGLVVNGCSPASIDNAVTTALVSSR